MKYLIIFIILVGAIVTAVKIDWSGEGGDEANDLTDALFTVKRGVLDITIAEEGYLKAKNSVQLKPKFRREGVISWIVEEGTTVEKDDLLVEFEKTDLTKQVADLENSKIQYETELKAAQATMKIQERENVASIESAELGLEMSKMKLERYVKGDQPNDRRKLKLAVNKAESELRRQQEQWAEVPNLEKEGFFTKIQVENEKLKLEEAQISVANAKKELELFEKYTVPMETKQRESDVRDAERKLLDAKEMADIKKNEKLARVKQQERQLDATVNRLEKYQEELEQMTMKAPSPGIVHYGEASREWELEHIKVGGRIWPGITVITLPDLSEMQAVIEIHEADIDQIEEGMEAVVTVDAVQGVSFPGKVSKIASVASSHRSDMSKTFRVEVVVETAKVELRAGISARVEILVEKVPDVLYIPIHAVFSEGAERFCFVVTDKKVERRDVTTGKTNIHYVEIEGGLEENESVMLYDPRDTGQFGGGAEGEEIDEPDGEASGDGSPLAVPGLGGSVDA